MQYQPSYPIEGKSSATHEANHDEFRYNVSTPPVVAQPFLENQHVYLQYAPPVPIPVPPTKFGFISQRHICQFCGAQMVTTTETQSGLLTWLLAGGLCIFGLFFGCCLVPFFIDSTKDVQHSCPHCNQVVGISQRLQK